MKIDPYTKIVLTVIAASLLVIAGQGFIPNAIAGGFYTCSGKLESPSPIAIGQKISFDCYSRG